MTITTGIFLVSGFDITEVMGHYIWEIYSMINTDSSLMDKQYNPLKGAVLNALKLEEFPPEGIITEFTLRDTESQNKTLQNKIFQNHLESEN